MFIFNPTHDLVRLKQKKINSLKYLFAFGIAFEIPIATILLVKSGIATKASLAKARPYLIILFLVIGMLLTPPDIFSQLFLAIPMWILFELGILISRDKN